MADEQDFPTAIIPTRPGSFQRRYDALVAQFGDPLTRMFGFMGHGDDELAFKATKELLEHDHSKPKNAPDFNIQANAGSSLVINLGADPRPERAAEQEIDVSPAPSVQDPEVEEMLR